MRAVNRGIVTFRTASIAVLVLAVAACGGRRELYLSSLDVTPLSWDTLSVDVRFAARGAIGAPRDVDAQDLAVRLFDSEYRLLYEGSGPTVPVPDGSLGNRERLVLEACGALEGATICDQRMLEASPKRVSFSEEVTYPRNGRFDRGTYDFGLRLERQAFGSASWEPVPQGAVPGAYLVASVDGAPETSIRVPIVASEGQFDLSDYDNYPEFEYRMMQALERRNAVPVRLEVYSGLDAEEPPLASIERLVREKTREEREVDLERFVRLASERLLERFEPYDRASAYVQRWQFDAESRRYDIRMRLAWEHRAFGRRVVDGDLQVGEDGANAVFTRRDVNRQARRPWRQQVGTDRVSLGTLEPEFAAPEEADPTARELARRL